MAAIGGKTIGGTGRPGVGKIVLASLVGTTIEFYDFYIFGTAAALVFGPMFFPKSAPETQTLNAYLTFGLAFLARPVGSFLFGHFGDRIGRKSTLVATMLTMGLATTLIGALPGYATAGVARALAAGAAALCPGRRARRRMGRRGADRGRKRAARAGAPGSACSPSSGRRSASSSPPASFSCFSLAFGEKAFVDWAWRVPFLLSAVLVAIGLYVRVSLEETPAFRAALRRERAGRRAARRGAARPSRAARSRARSRSSSATRYSISRPSTRSATA